MNFQYLIFSLLYHYLIPICCFTKLFPVLLIFMKIESFEIDKLYIYIVEISKLKCIMYTKN